MKTTSLCAVLLLAGLCAAPLCAGTALQEAAVSAAAPDSDASLSDICYAVYQAVKDDPSQADKVLAAVIAQRETWTSTQVYAILRSTMMACPDLAAYVSASRSAEGGSAQQGELPAMLQRLLDVLNRSALPTNVVQGARGNVSVSVSVFDSGEVVPAPGQMSPQH